MKRAIAGIIIVASVVSLPALGQPRIEGPTLPEVSRPVEGLTVNEVRELHREFDPGFTAWTGGGPSTRYIYVHPWEFWPQFVLRREGPIQPLPLDPRIEIQDLTVPVSSGEWTLADYVDESHVDAMVVLHQGKIVFESYPRSRNRRVAYLAKSLHRAGKLPRCLRSMAAFRSCPEVVDLQRSAGNRRLVAAG